MNLGILWNSCLSINWKLLNHCLKHFLSILVLNLLDMLIIDLVLPSWLKRVPRALVKRQWFLNLLIESSDWITWFDRSLKKPLTQEGFKQYSYLVNIKSKCLLYWWSTHITLLALIYRLNAHGLTLFYIGLYISIWSAEA